MEDKKLLVSVNVCTFGTADVCGIGLAVSNQNAKILFKTEWWIETNLKHDLLCKGCSLCIRKREFWDKNQLLLAIYENKKKPERQQIEEFVYLFDNVHANFGFEEDDVELVSNNPDLDFGLLNELVKKHCNRDPLMYTKKGNYRPVRNYFAYTELFGLNTIFESHTKPHDYHPSNIAENALFKHAMVLKFAEAFNASVPSKQILEENTASLCVSVLKDIS